jgi:hypothetical protein
VCSCEEGTIGAAAFGSGSIANGLKSAIRRYQSGPGHGDDNTRRDVIERDEGAYGHPVADLILSHGFSESKAIMDDLQLMIFDQVLAYAGSR